MGPVVYILLYKFGINPDKLFEEAGEYVQFGTPADLTHGVNTCMALAGASWAPAASRIRACKPA
jgi:hypothetical protein